MGMLSHKTFPKTKSNMINDDKSPFKCANFKIPANSLLLGTYIKSFDIYSPHQHTVPTYLFHKITSNVCVYVVCANT